MNGAVAFPGKRKFGLSIFRMCVLFKGKIDALYVLGELVK